jgi:RimJ/RimL family protein N-acetyltransferase
MRPFRVGDLDRFHAIMASDEVRAPLRLPEGFGREDAWRSLTSHAGLWELRGLGQWAIDERVSGRFVGRAGLYWRVEPDWPGVEVGWMLDPAVWRHGYATEAGARAVRYGFEDVGEDVLYSVILPGNTRSEAVAGRLGFTPFDERTLSFFPAEPHVVWRLDRSTWETVRSSLGP